MFIRSKCVLGVTAKDGTCPIYPGFCAEVDDAEGKRAVESGYAVEITAVATERPGSTGVASQTSVNPSTEETAQNGPGNAGNGQIAGHLDRDQLQEMSYTDLKALAKDMGIETGKIKSKAGMIEAICAVEVYADADDPEEAPPVFDAQDVID